ncbi:amidase signature enzyme [Sporormia fimetaria CBS 119925]|uniref:Amidase signature enzyme n=1 Tax=Sporormia fimetaria CBS 119925 TaxID=1340428 RepID=A0A6A6VGD9_9PLEO|nr:amidase signature enzyme [Sporormia fimetaria CBS 119925]
MRTFTTLSLGSLLTQALSAAISPDYHSLIWKSNDQNFWAPLGLNTTTYALESPAGTAPEALSKRGRSSSQGHQYLPCTVVTLDDTLSSKTLESIVNQYRAIGDDVWSEEQFMDCLFVQSSKKSRTKVDHSSLSRFIDKNKVSDVFVSKAYNVKGLKTKAAVSSVPTNYDLPNGPYVVSLSDRGQELDVTPVYGLHEDAWEAFMSGSIPHNAVAGSHLTLQVSIPGTRAPAIIVPSRIGSVMASKESSKQSSPLAGLRFAVKDIFHVKGLKTSGGSRAYYQVYGPQNYTTETVEKTLTGGAQLVGKTRTIAFALSAPANGKEIDYLDPWNPRGDGYQTTGGSSSGSGSAATAYDWLDFTIGSDTGGSVRFPARFGGLYGYKPTHGIFNQTGILVAIAEQDTPGFLTRSPSIFTRLGKWWAKDTPLEDAANTPMPTHLLYYADEPALVQPEAEAMKLAFFANVSTVLNMTTSSINVTETWLSHGPSNGEPIPSYMTHVYSDQNSIQFYENIGKPLAERYAELNNGSYFPADPMVNASFYDAQNSTTIARLPTSIRKRELFSDFWNTWVQKPLSKTCSESFFAHSYHVAPGAEKVTYTPVGVVTRYYNGVYTNFAGIPEIVVPIGQVRYWSRYTLREEWQPVTVAFAAAKGCDLKLFELVERLEEAGLLRETLAGKVAYHTDEVW